MTQGKLLSALDISEELNTGKATIKFILKRFKKWLPHELVNGMPYYLPESIKTIIKIVEYLETGILPGEIDEYLDPLFNSETDHIPNSSIKILQAEDIRLNKEGVILLKSLFSELSEQQRRIAIAHEKRAAAEERKAVAIEKRAEAEEKKAEAMNNIANALQEMNRFRGGIEPIAQKIAHQAVEALIIDETNETYTIPKDDLSLLIEIESPDEKNLPDKLDDLSALIENESKFMEIDDLSALLDKESLESPATENLDDLSILIDRPIDGSDRIENTSQETILSDSQESMDDLTRLITPTDALMDDLSKLIEPAEPTQLFIPEGRNLKETKSLKMDLSPDDDIEKYKAAIMKVILELKTDGMSAEETTLLLNKNKIRTLSGKPEWSQKAISQIYKFMTAVK
ncbi:MAG: hypothetical protein A2097_05080 [Desulfobacula sp. GWF2_41_7]|nr:MAG: hypothetical protein A2097_05080 [Desulfobacula sp. GWF2_41_7]